MQLPFYQKADKVQIRYNTDSDGIQNAWRLVVDGKEMRANHVDIKKQCCTTCDWLADKKSFKHHITVVNCIVQIDGSNNAIIS